MGLDITAYQQLSPAPAEWIGPDGEVIDERYDEVFRFYGDNADFPGRGAGLEPGAYLYEVADGFCPGPYSRYNRWREALAQMVGYPATNGRGDYHQHSAGAWAATAGPFWELINFSDCDGVIGPTVAAKLARDFQTWDAAAAERVDADDFYGMFTKFRRAFEMAAQGGAVRFH